MGIHFEAYKKLFEKRGIQLGVLCLYTDEYLEDFNTITEKATYSKSITFILEFLFWDITIRVSWDERKEEM